MFCILPVVIKQLLYHMLCVIIFVVFFLSLAEYGKDLEDAVCGDTSGMFQRVLVSLLTVSKQQPMTYEHQHVNHQYHQRPYNISVKIQLD